MNKKSKNAFEPETLKSAKKLQAAHEKYLKAYQGHLATSRVISSYPIDGKLPMYDTNAIGPFELIIATPLGGRLSHIIPMPPGYLSSSSVGIPDPNVQQKPIKRRKIDLQGPLNSSKSKKKEINKKYSDLLDAHNKLQKALSKHSKISADAFAQGVIEHEQMMDELTRIGILQQAGATLLAQANNQAQMALSLLR